MSVELNLVKWNFWPLTWTRLPNGIYADGVNRVLHIGPLKLEWPVGDRGKWR